MYNYNTALFHNDSEVKFYIIGLILADGHISKNWYRIELMLKESDKPFLKMIRDYICPGKPLKYKPNLKAWKFQFDNKEISMEIMKYVNDRRKSTHLMFPYGIPDEFVLPFIRGYSDGDGNIGVKYGRRTLADGSKKRYFGLRYRILGTRQFLLGLSFNLYRLNIARNQVNPHRKGKENCYYIEYGFQSAERILNAIYNNATIMLPRKYQVFNYIVNSDNATLEKAYGTPEGYYNTCASNMEKV